MFIRNRVTTVSDKEEDFVGTFILNRKPTAKRRGKKSKNLLSVFYTTKAFRVLQLE